MVKWERPWIENQKLSPTKENMKNVQVNNYIYQGAGKNCWGYKEIK